MARNNYDTNHSTKPMGGRGERGKNKTSRRGGGDGIQLTFADWLLLVALQRATMREGGAVRVGLTRDGGALSLGMYIGEDYGTEYIRPNEDVGTALLEVARAWLPSEGSAFGEAYDWLEQEIKTMLSEPGKKPTDER